jgi:hypothetical protein
MKVAAICAGVLLALTTAGNAYQIQARYLPRGVNSADRRLMQAWSSANEGCQGGTDVTPESPVCRRRDHLVDVLERHGWCWAYRDYRILPTQYRWHRCYG